MPDFTTLQETLEILVLCEIFILKCLLRIQNQGRSWGQFLQAKLDLVFLLDLDPSHRSSICSF